jgi:hypothetical protein
VLENEPETEGEKIEQPLVEGFYNFARSNLDDVKEAKGEVHSEVKQAFTAVRLARRAGAATLAKDEFIVAQQSLKKTLTLWQARQERNEIAAQARETIRLAVAAQRLAEDRALQRSRQRTEGSGAKSARPESQNSRISTH